jgi:hypothetical protein
VTVLWLCLVVCETADYLREVSFSVRKRGRGSPIFLALFARWWERSARWTRALVPRLGGPTPPRDPAPLGVSVVHPVNMLLAVISEFWLCVCAELSPRALETSSPCTEQLENLPQPWCRHHRGCPLPPSLTRVGIGRCRTLFERRPRPGAGTRMRHERWVGRSPISPPSRMLFALRRKRCLPPGSSASGMPRASIFYF